MSQVIAIVGGTGALGKGLAMRWLKAGRQVLVGTRDVSKADEYIASVNAVLTDLDAGQLSVLSNEDAAEKGDIVVLTVPYAHHENTLQSIKPALQSKILIDATVPLKPPKVAVVQLPETGSAAQEAHRILNSEESDNISVVSAFQNVAAAHLQSMNTIECDVLVCGAKAARESVLPLIEEVGVKAFSAGPLANAAAQEALTSVLIAINKQYKCHAGIRISGLHEE